MKKTLFVWLAAALFLASCASQPADQVTIKGDIDGLDNEMVYLKVRVDRKWVDIDSALVKNGKFSLQGKITEPQIAYLAPKNKSEDEEDAFPAFEIFIEPGDIKLTGHVADPNFKVSGSQSHADKDLLETELEPYSERSKTLYEAYMTAAGAGDAALLETLEKEFDALDAEEKTIKEIFIRNHPKSFYALHLIRSNLIYTATLEELEQYQAWLDSEILNAPTGVFLTERIALLKRMQIGQPAPEVSLPDTSGVVLHLSSMKGKYVLVDFWASWCTPCRRENPNVVAAYQAFHDKGFDILGISLDDNQAKWKEAIHKDNLTWSHVIDNGWNGESVKTYGVLSIPSNYLLDPDGNIVATQLRGKDLHDKLAELLD